MNKVKTNRGAAKRFKFTKKGNVKRKKAGASHILTKKSRKRKRGLRQAGFLSGSDKGTIKKLVPYK